MTPEELEIKFKALADPVMSDARQAELKDCIFKLETVDNVSQLMQLTVGDK
jgi:hypothetical protein